jgi:hypothetical protein
MRVGFLLVVDEVGLAGEVFVQFVGGGHGFLL